MNEKVYRYSFSNKLDIQDIEDSLFLAVFAAECLHGRSRIRLDASFRLEKKKEGMSDRCRHGSGLLHRPHLYRFSDSRVQ